MKKIMLGSVFALLASAGGASAHDPWGPPGPPPADDCLCTRTVTFYGPIPPPPMVTVRGPGVRVIGAPIVIPGGRINIQAPPVYVDAPPIRVLAPQIYLARPDVYVRPSTVTVEPPEVHFEACDPGEVCTPAPHP